MNAIDQGLIKRPAVLLVESLDRISRANIMDALQIFIRILNTGIAICTYHDGYVYSKEIIEKDFSGLLISITYMLRSHDESKNKSFRIKESWMAKREKINPKEAVLKNILPWWIEVVDGKPVVNKHEAKVVKIIFDLCVKENMSYGSILKYLRENEVTDKVSNTAMLYRLFNTKKVLGIYEPGKVIVGSSVDKNISTGEEIKAYPAIVSKKIYYQARAAIAKRKTVGKGRPATRDVNYFKGVMNCPYCGSSLVMFGNDKNASYFRCHKREKYKYECGYKAILQTRKLQPVLLYAISLINNDDVLESVSNKKRICLLNEINALEAELEEKRQRIANLTALVESGSKTGVKRVVELEKDVERIKESVLEKNETVEELSSPSMARSLSDINMFYKKILFDNITEKERHAFSQSLINVIDKMLIFNPKDGGCRAVIKIELKSGIKMKIVVGSDYKSLVYKGAKKIGQIEAR